MASRIEDIIEEIEDYIDSCKPFGLSGSKVIINRDELDGFLDELKTKTPEEIKRYQKIISNKEAILADAQKKADAIIAQAQIQTNELVSEHQIMQQAYAQANEVVMIATKNAQEMLDKATEDANNIRLGAIDYTDGLLSNIQEVISNSMETTKARTDNYLTTMQGYLDTVVANRDELVPKPEAAQKSPDLDSMAVSEPETVSKPEQEEADSISVPDSFFHKE